jgi:tetratricopeptide (TPR) repeat protein
LKNITRPLPFLALILLNYCSPASTKVGTREYVYSSTDSTKILTEYSLFSEYYKNKDCNSALPYGWSVLQMDPKRFAKWIYYKMEDCLWYLHDSSNASPEMIKSIDDTILHFYGLALENYPEAKGYFQVRKAFVSEIWLGEKDDTVIKEYEDAFAFDPNLTSYYYNRLGQLYKKNMGEGNDYRTKAIDLYSMLGEREPNTPQWPIELESLVENIDELVDLTKKTWDLDKENLAKAWKYAALAIKASRYEEAIVPLEFLVGKEPESINYWNQLATAYQKVDKVDKAESALKKLILLDPENKVHYLNLGILYKDKGQLQAARSQYQKANDVGKGWGQAIFNEGLLYEQAARGCEFNFETKCVYQLAVDTYRKAKNTDASISQQAQDRINALSNSVPTQEDYFFRKLKSGTVIPITGTCFGWIGKSITVP